MTRIFQDIKVKWDGVEYTIDSDDQIMVMLAKFEEIIPILEFLSKVEMAKTVPIIKISQVFTMVLNFAGCDVKHAEVYKEIFANQNFQNNMVALLHTLASMIVPQQIIEEAETVGKSEARPKTKSKKRKVSK